MNEADLNGNWSDAAFLNTSVDNPTPTQGPDPSPDGVPVWVFGVIGGVVLATLVALVVVTIFIANRRYCFHWCSKVSGTHTHTQPHTIESTDIGLPAVHVPHSVTVCVCVCVCVIHHMFHRKNLLL